MALILDTHYVYALAGAPTKLTRREQKFLAAPRTRLLVSAVSIWEIRIKWSTIHASGDRKGPAAPERVIEALADQGVEYLSLTYEHAALELSHPLAHSDPFDELLLAQAQAEGVRLLTRDARLASHPLARTIA